MAHVEDILAMKLNVIAQGGRIKDFWDVHALLNQFNLHEMLMIYERRYPYNATREEILQQLIVFQNADEDPDPNCLQGQYWELIKYDFEELVDDYKTQLN